MSTNEVKHAMRVFYFLLHCVAADYAVVNSAAASCGAYTVGWHRNTSHTPLPAGREVVTAMGTLALGSHCFISPILISSISCFKYTAMCIDGASGHAACVQVTVF